MSAFNVPTQPELQGMKEWNFSFFSSSSLKLVFPVRHHSPARLI